MSKQKFATAPYDRENATYRQTIFFTNGKSVDGYSKKVGFNEPVDSTNCLTNFILRMYLSGYLRANSDKTPIHYIDYQFNKTSDHIATLYYLYPEPDPSQATNVRFLNWLTNFYRDVNEGKNLVYIEKKYYRNGRESREHKLDPEKHLILSPDHLISKVKLLVREGQYSSGEIQYYFRQCMQKFFPQKVQTPEMKSYENFVNRLVNAKRG